MRSVARRSGIGRHTQLAVKIAPVLTQSLRRPLPWRYIQSRIDVLLKIYWLEGARTKMSTSGRLLGFNIGDWSIVAAGLAFVGLLTMLF
jgi:hypothetical protein